MNTGISNRRAPKCIGGACFLLLVIFCFSGICLADLATGKYAIEMEEYKKAWIELLPLAESGNSEAQILVGQMYNNGNGVPVNLVKGAEYYQRAAKGGNSRAQALLAFLYTAGRGVEKSHKKALYWYSEAANNGDAYAQLDLARMYRTGANLDANYIQSYKWYYIVSKNKDICDCLLDGKEIVASMMTQHEIYQAKTLANEWLKQHSQ